MEELDTFKLPHQFRAAGIAAGIKKQGGKDMAVIVSDTDAAVAGTFTTNQVQAATVKWCRERLAGGRARAIVVNSGCANACTGEAGRADTGRTAERAAELLGIGSDTVFVCSTGHIGTRLPMDKIEAGVRTAVSGLRADGGLDASEAIMTTDTRPKRHAFRFTVDGRDILLAGMAKGAGMIEPNMATMLAFLLTDAAVEPSSLQEALSASVNRSFNRISVDGDRSTNDTVLQLANGAAGNKLLSPRHPDWPAFREALDRLTAALAFDIVGDGEGAHKVITITVSGAASDAEADLAARAVANSFLVKTSWAGHSANWGRIMDALGYSRARVEEGRVDIDYDGVPAVRRGIASTTTPAELARIVGQPRFSIDIRLHVGEGSAVVYTCECTEEYVRINL